MPRRLQVTDVNPHVICTLCDGYLVDATAIIKCLHAFCRTCIVRYLENSKFCPVCDVQVHKTKPLSSIRSDQTLQDVVYKLVPELYQNEMQRRREFYAEHPQAASGRSPEERGDGEFRFFSTKESISLSLQHLKSTESKSAEQSGTKDPMTRHLNCPAAFTVGHIKKFIQFKFSLPPTCKVDIFYDEHLLKDSFTLMDVAYIYSWKRAEPMKFLYTIAKRIPKFIEPPPPLPEAVPFPAVEAVHSNDEDVPAIVPDVSVASTTVESESMEVDVEVSKPECEQVDEAPAEEANVDASKLFTTSSKNDITELKVQCNSSQPIKSIPAPLMPEPTYNSVKVVSAPESNTLLSPTNGFRLKFIHDPELNPKKSSSKKSGRKGGRSSRHKSAPVRLARLAPYPPPPPSVTCLTTNQHLSQLTVGKLVPTVITTLAPTFVTTLVSTTSNSLCNNVTNNVSNMSNFLGQPSAVCAIATPNALLPPPALPSTADNAVTLSSTSSTMAASACSLSSAVSQMDDASILTKELDNAKASSSNSAIVASSEKTPPSSNIGESVRNNSAHPSECDTSSPSNSLVDSQQTNSHIPDSSLPSSPKPVVSSSTKDADSSEVVTSTSGDQIVPVLPAVPTPQTDCDVQDSFQEVTDVKLASERTPRFDGLLENNDLKDDVTSGDFSTNHEDKNISSLASANLEKHLLSPKESIFMSTKCNQEKINDTLTKISVTDEQSCESSSSISVFGDKSILSSEEPNRVIVDTNSTESFRPNYDKESFKDSARNNNKSLEEIVKGTISAEFSDNDDLGCQSDLVVDEQKAQDSSENEEDDTDVALRKKINAIAEKEDETDDTEADSGRASDMSCPARCEEDVGSPMATDPSSIASSAAAISHQHHIKSNTIDNVIKQLYLQHEISRSPSSPKPASATPQRHLHPQPEQQQQELQKQQKQSQIQPEQQQQEKQQELQQAQRDDTGVLDLSTCTRKPGDSPVQSTRQRPVANPVLDIKHRQQTYMPAPVRQHTACVPTPKHPTSSPLLMHQLTAHPSILQAQLTGKSSHSHHHHPAAYTPYPLPSSNNRTVSSPSPLAARPSPPSYSYRFAHQNAASGGSVNLLAGMLPYASVMSNMVGFPSRAGVTPPPRPSSTTLPHRKDVASPPTSNSSKMASSPSAFNNHLVRHTEKKNWSPTPPSRKLSDALLTNCRGPATSPTSVPAHPRTSPSMLRLSPLHKSASPAPTPHSVSSSSSSSSLSISSSGASQGKASVPIYKKDSSYKSYNKFKRSANLAVFNPDPNGYRQKLVIKNLDSRPNANNSHHHHHNH